MTQTAPNDIAALVAHVNELLEAGEPHNISIDEHSGYTGYKPQYVVDAMNEAFGLGGWGFEELDSSIDGADKVTLVVSKVKVWIKDVTFQPAAWGQGRITRGDVGDARKSAQTDALKKALSYFSIGAKAYQGLLKAKEGNGQKQAQATNGSAVQAKKAPSQEQVSQQKSNGPSLSDLVGRAKNRAIQLGVVHNADEWQALLQHLKIVEIKTAADLAKVGGYLSNVEQKKTQSVAK